MVCWGRAFGTAVKIVLVSVGWYVLGVVVALAILRLAVDSTIIAALSQPSALLNPLRTFAVIGQLLETTAIAFTVGGIISALGAISTFLRYSAELFASEVQATSETETIALHPTATPKSSATLRSKTCYSCGGANANTDSYCRHCGAQLRRLKRNSI